jgi:hypothetical protein
VTYVLQLLLTKDTFANFDKKADDALKFQKLSKHVSRCIVQLGL